MAKVTNIQVPNPDHFEWLGGGAEKTSSASAIMSHNTKMQSLLGQQGGQFKFSGLQESQLEGYIREVSVLSKAMPSEPIDFSQCEAGATHDTMYYRVHMQYETRAFLSTFEALPRQVQEVYIPRVFVSFMMLTTPTYVLNELNLPVYPFPVGKQIQDNVALDMHEARDWTMLDNLESLIQASAADYGNILRGAEAQANIETAGANTGFRGRLERDDLLAFKMYYADSRARLNAVIVPESDYMSLERFTTDDYGDGLMERIFLNGLDADQVHGVTLIRTIKIDETRGDVFRKGNLYGFAAPNMIGRNFDLRGLKFHVDKDHQFLSFDASMAIGFLWANASRVCKMELYNGGRDTAGTLLGTPADPPTSDQYFGSPEDVTAKDYFEVEKGYRRPFIQFTGS